MIAGLLRLAWLGLAALVIAGGCAMPTAWSPLWALLLPAALLALLAAVLACEFALVPALGPVRPAPVPPVRALLTAWRLEWWASCRLLAWRMPVLSGRGSHRPAPPALPSRGLVLVHGYGCNAGVWAAWLRQLRSLGLPCVAVNLEPPFASMADYRPIIEAAVAAMQRRTGLAPVLVAHSMGGLVARAWWAQDARGERLHRLITIGSPHQGSLMARLGWGANARQMRPTSAWLAGLRAKEMPVHAQKTQCFYSDCDNIVFPTLAATLPGADNRLVPRMGHLALLDHPVIVAAAVQALQLSD